MADEREDIGVLPDVNSSDTLAVKLLTKNFQIKENEVFTKIIVNKIIWLSIVEFIKYLS